MLVWAGLGVLGLFGLPVYALMGAIALLAFYGAEIEVSAVAVEMYRLASAPTLLSIPLFTFAGYVMAESKSPERLLKLASVLFGNFRGGTAIVGIVLCAFFTAFTGASGVTIIALGGLLMPILVKEGYSERFSLGLITTCGSLGLLFPPSLPIILYGIIAKVDIDKLFRAGILPGIFLMLVLAGWSMLQAPPKKAKVPFTWARLRDALWLNRWELPLAPLVLGGIYGGFTTTTEAATLSAMYVLFAQCALYRDLSFWRDIPRIASESLTLVGAILIILCAAMGMTNFLVDQEVPMKILAAMQGWIGNKWLFLLVLNIFLLVVGCLMDIFSAIIVVVPLIVPVANEFGVDPYHLAIVFLTNLEIGYITPPVGINLFISSFRFNRPILELYRVSFPFLLLLLGALVVITYLPWLTLFLLSS
jgi:C4-dicarboxylate transporter DctM subunit